MNDALLKIETIDTFIEQFHILQGVSVSVANKGITVLLGRNGAGKTTTLRSIMGMVNVTQGKITFDGTSLVGKKPHTIAKLGIGYVPEHRAIFKELSVRENLEIASRKKGDFDRNIDMILELFPDLKRLIHLKGGNLSGGQQQMLAIGRALIPDNKLLLIDEPSEGLAPVLIEQMIDAIRELSKQKTVLLVEQNFVVARKLADHYVIIDDGHSVATGTMDTLNPDDDVVKRYLGVGIH
jgi:branched-chain amino acid transport system ATP-binding protein